jgi:hypothetical protein
MTKLSKLVDEELIAALRAALDAGRFPGITFTQAMEFLLTDGTFPASDLPLASFLELEDWARRRPPA